MTYFTCRYCQHPIGMGMGAALNICWSCLSKVGERKSPKRMERIYIDMDGVLCDFYGAAKKELEMNPSRNFPQSRYGFFLSLPEIEGAIDAVKELQKKYEVWILTRPSFMNIGCYSEKAQWVQDHLGFDMLKRTIFSGDKSLLIGDYLIDDQDNANQREFKGKWFRFGSNEYPDWDSILAQLV